ncbi:hypothetical protein Tco_1228165 [Tanacetum coccineum]
MGYMYMFKGLFQLKWNLLLCSGTPCYQLFAPSHLFLVILSRLNTLWLPASFAKCQIHAVLEALYNLFVALQTAYQFPSPATVLVTLIPKRPDLIVQPFEILERSPNSLAFPYPSELVHDHCSSHTLTQIEEITFVAATLELKNEITIVKSSGQHGNDLLEPIVMILLCI